MAVGGNVGREFVVGGTVSVENDLVPILLI